MIVCHDHFQVGCDIVVIKSLEESLEEFFSTMTQCFDSSEWCLIRSHSTPLQCLRQFYILWAHKESYIKAIGLGLHMSLAVQLFIHRASSAVRLTCRLAWQRITFSYGGGAVECSVPPTSSWAPLLAPMRASVDGKPLHQWRFSAFLLDDVTCAVVAVGAAQFEHRSITAAVQPTRLTFEELQDKIFHSN